MQNNKCLNQRRRARKAANKQEKLLINLISQIDNLVLKEEYLKKFKKTLIKEENDKRVKQLDETLERFNKKKSKEITVNNLQHEITNIKREIIK